MTADSNAPLSVRAYARHRGVSHTAVAKAIESGRLRASVTRDAKGTAKIADPDLADREWAAATDLSKAPAFVKQREAARAPGSGSGGAVRPLPGGPPLPPGGMGELADFDVVRESAREKHWKANKAEIEYRERIGQLVDAEEMKTAVADAFVRVRGRLGGLPTRIRQQIPHLSADEVGVIESFVREALEELVLKLEDDEDDEDDGGSGDGA